MAFSVNFGVFETIKYAIQGYSSQKIGKCEGALCRLQTRLECKPRGCKQGALAARLVSHLLDAHGRGSIKRMR